MFELPQLPYGLEDLAPHISKETLEYHHGKHHNAYVAKLNGLVAGTDFENMSLEDVVKTAPKGGVFNNAAQIWNHTFYWHSLTPKGGGEPSGALLKGIEESFGSFAEFKNLFTTTAATHFGSGWVWLVKNKNGTLEIVTTKNAENPMTEGYTPILTCDVWEHAYYIDYRNARPKYIEAFWALVNWGFAGSNY